MILYNLRCAEDHEFEAWFKDSGTYDRQVEGGEVVCPVCGDLRVGKAIMAPRLSRTARKGAGETPHPVGGAEPKYVQALRDDAPQGGRELRLCRPRLRRRGAQDPQRRDSDERSIYGEATEDEAKTLIEEEVPFGRVPWVPREDA